MITDLPESIKDTLHDLSPEGMIYLYQLKLPDETLFLMSPTVERTWLGETYEEVPCNLVGVGQFSDGKAARPKFTVANPGGVFNRAIYDGALENALVTRIQILESDLANDNDFAMRETWRISRVVNVGNHMVVTELRDALDGRQFKIPPRAYTPPEFNHVKLQ